VPKSYCGQRKETNVLDRNAAFLRICRVNMSVETHENSKSTISLCIMMCCELVDVVFGVEMGGKGLG